MGEGNTPFSDFFCGRGEFKDPNTLPSNLALSFINKFTDDRQIRARTLESTLSDIFPDESFKKFISDLNIIESHISSEQREFIKTLISLRTLLLSLTTSEEEEFKFENFFSLAATVVNYTDLESVILLLQNAAELCSDHGSTKYLSDKLISIILCSEMIIEDEDLYSAGKYVAKNLSFLVGILESIERKIKPDFIDVDFLAARFSPFFDGLTTQDIDEGSQCVKKFAPEASDFFELYLTAKKSRNESPVEPWFAICNKRLPINFFSTLIQTLLFEGKISEQSRSSLQSIAQTATLNGAFTSLAIHPETSPHFYKSFLQKLKDTYVQTHLLEPSHKNKKFIDAVIDGILTFEKTAEKYQQNVETLSYLDLIVEFVSYDQEYFLNKLSCIINDQSLTPNLIRRLHIIFQCATFVIENFPEEKKKSSLREVIRTRRETTVHLDRQLDEALSEFGGLLDANCFNGELKKMSPRDLFRRRR